MGGKKRCKSKEKLAKLKNPCPIKPERVEGVYESFGDFSKTDIHFNFEELSGEAKRVVNELKKSSIPFLIVGGFVRDWIEGRKSLDVDMVAVSDAYILVRVTGGKYIRAKHPVVSCRNLQISPCENLNNWYRARDLTVNCLAIDSEGFVHDPNSGVEDVKNGVLRISSTKSFFVKDPFRTFRAIRLAASRNWKFEKKVKEAFQSVSSNNNYSGLIYNHAPRFSIELRKVLGEEKPSKFFKLLLKYDLLQLFCPDLYSVAKGNKKILKACDVHGTREKRMAFLFHEIFPQNNKKACRKLYKYLTDICWDLVGYNFNHDNHFVFSNEIAQASFFYFRKKRKGIAEKLKTLKSMGGKVTLDRLKYVYARIFGEELE